MAEGKETLTNQYTSKILGFLFLLTLLSGLVIAQQTPVVVPTPKKILPKVKPDPKPKNKEYPETSPPTAEMPGVPTGETPPVPDGKEKHWSGDDSVEKFIEVDSEVQINLCVSEGNIKINGWDRDEIRVFVNHGSKAGFKPLGKNEDGKPTKVAILGYDPTKDKGKDIKQCLSGDEIELDVPNQTNLAALTGTAGMVSVTVESIARASIKINQGDIQLREIGEGIKATTHEGDIRVEDSSGAIELDATNGGILVYNVEPLEEGDILRAKTFSGSLVLQSTSHSVIDLTSNTGLIKFTGEIQTDGQYTFRNTNGQILLGIPKDSSCQVEVNAQKGKFSYDVPLKIVTENVYPPSMVRTTAELGDAEASLKLINQNGRIVIKKIN